MSLLLVVAISNLFADVRCCFVASLGPGTFLAGTFDTHFEGTRLACSIKLDQILDQNILAPEMGSCPRMVCTTGFG